MEIKGHVIKPYISVKIFINQLTQDASLQALLLVNIFTIFVAIKEGWGLGTLMWVYWFQSIIIGIFNVVRIVRLKNFSTDGVKMNNQTIPPTKGSKYLVAGFFTIHYGLFHLVYFFFLLLGFTSLAESSSSVAWSFVFGTSFMFFCNHLFSYLYNKDRDTQTANIGTLMFLPYARILPMHLTIIFAPMFAFFATIPLLIFLLLKTVADMITHVLEHSILKKNLESKNI